MLYLVVVLALAALRPSPRVLVTLGVLVVLTAFIAIGLGFFMPEAGLLRESGGVVRERTDKALLPGFGLLQGMFTSENNLGQYLSLGFAAVVLLPRWWLRLPGMAVVAFAIIWSSSRSSLLATGATLAVGAVVWVLAELGWRRTASFGARVAIGVSLLVMCVLPLLRWDNAAFTARGQIWNGSLEQWQSRSFLFGLGRGWYVQIAGTETSPLNTAAYHGHNQFVQWLVTGGVVLALVALAWLLVQGYVLTAPDRRYVPIAAMVIVAIAVGGFLEVPLGFVDRSVFWTVTVVPLTVLFFARPRDVRLPTGVRP